MRALRAVRIADPEARFSSLPHELSGGMKQRVLLALALANDPDLLVLDEPTTALDVTTQAALLDLLAEQVRTRQLSLLLVTHDRGVVAEMCDDIVVLAGGRVAGSGAVSEWSQAALLDAQPWDRAPGAAEAFARSDARRLR